MIIRTWRMKEGQLEVVIINRKNQNMNLTMARSTLNWIYCNFGPIMAVLLKHLEMKRSEIRWIKNIYFYTGP